MKLVFTAWLLMNGVWTHGSAVDGWWPVVAASEEKCQEYLEYSLEHPTEGVKFTCETLEDTQEWVWR